MENAILNNIVWKTKPLLPQLCARTEREKLEQACERMVGLAELAATWRGLMEIYGNLTPNDSESMGEYIVALDAQFARAFIKSFPSVEDMQDTLVEGCLNAVLEAKDDANSVG